MGDLSRQLVDQVTRAAAANQPLAITGGGSKPFLGRGLRGESLSLAGHTGIISYEPVELVLTARAGTPLADIEAALAENNQQLAFDPPRFGDTDTIGGTLAANLSGPGRPWQGSVRDHVLGLRLINGKGEHLAFGGRVMKNVAGYDVSRLQAGALGTLGVITEVSLKVLPRPAMERTLVRPMDQQQAIAVMNHLAGQPKPLSAACWYEGNLYLRLSGAAAAVEATATRWMADSDGEMSMPEDGDEFWRDLRDQRLPFFKGSTTSVRPEPVEGQSFAKGNATTARPEPVEGQSSVSDNAPLWRFAVNPTAALQELGDQVLIDWGGAQRWSRQEAPLSVMAGQAARAGGQVSLFRYGDRSGDVMHPQPGPLRAIQQRLKTAFDPRGIFNPGHLYSWL